MDLVKDLPEIFDMRKKSIERPLRGIDVFSRVGIPWLDD